MNCVKRVAMLFSVLIFCMGTASYAYYGKELVLHGHVADTDTGTQSPVIIEAERCPTNAEKRNIQGVDCLRLEKKYDYVEIPFEIKRAGPVKVWVRIHSRWPLGEDAFYWQIDDGKENFYIASDTSPNPFIKWMYGIVDVWNWVKLAEIDVKEGKHKLLLLTKNPDGGVSFDKVAFAFDEDFTRLNFLDKDLTDLFKSGIKTRYQFDNSNNFLSIENEEFDKASGIISSGASGGKVVRKDKDYEKDYVLVDFPEDREVEVWARVYLFAKSLAGGHAIEEFFSGAFLEADGQILGATYNVNEKQWHWTYMGKVRIKKGTHVFSVFKKGKPVLFDRMVLCAGRDARAEKWFNEEFAENIPFGIPNGIPANNAKKCGNWYLLGELANNSKINWTKDAKNFLYANTVEIGEKTGVLVVAHQLGIGLGENEVFNARRTPQQISMNVKGDNSGVKIRGIFYDKDDKAYEGVFAEKVDWTGWRTVRINLIDHTAFPLQLKYVVMDKNEKIPVKIFFEEPKFTRSLSVRGIPEKEVFGISEKKMISFSAESLDGEQNTAYVDYTVSDIKQPDKILSQGKSGLIEIQKSGIGKYGFDLQIETEGIYCVSYGVNGSSKQKLYFCAGEIKKGEFEKYVKELEIKHGAFRFQEGKDFAIEKIPLILVNGIDATSCEYADKMGYGDDRLRVREQDLSNSAGWPGIYVQPGFIAVDRKLGRFKFSEGDSDAVGLVGYCHTGFGFHESGFIIKDNFLYGISGEGSHPVIDLTDPAKPVLAYMYADWHFHRSNLIPYKEYFFMNTSNRGIVVFDNFLNPYSPGPFRQINLDLSKQAFLTNVFEEKEMLYMENGLILDVRNPFSPRVVKEEPVVKEIGKGYFVKEKGIAFGGFQNREMGIYDVKEPLSPKKIGKFYFPDKSFIVEFSNNNMIVNFDNKEMWVYDVSDVKFPSIKSKFIVKTEKEEIKEDETTTVLTLNAPICLAGACLVDNYLYVLDRINPHRDTQAGPHVGFSRIYVLEISGQKPVVKSVYQESLPSSFANVEYLNEHLIVDDFCYGIRILNIKDREQPKEVARVLTGGEVRHGSYVSDNDIAVLSNTFDGVVQVIDVKDPENPKRVGELADGTCEIYGARYQGKGNYLYAPEPYELQIVDIANPEKPVKTGTFIGPDGKAVIGEIGVRGDIACVASGRNLLVYNVKESDKPKFLGRTEVIGTYPVINGNDCYLVQRGGKKLSKIDISVPEQPRVVFVFDLTEHADETVFGTGHTAGMAISKGYLYAGSGTSWGRQSYLNIFDVSGDRIVRLKKMPLPLDSSPYYWADCDQDLTLSGNALSIGNYGWTTIYDISDAVNPKLMYRENVTPTWTTGVIRGGYLYYPGLKGLFIFDLPNYPQIPEGKLTVQY